MSIFYVTDSKTGKKYGPYQRVGGNKAKGGGGGKKGAYKANKKAALKSLQGQVSALRPGVNIGKSRLYVRTPRDVANRVVLAGAFGVTGYFIGKHIMAKQIMKKL